MTVEPLTRAEKAWIKRLEKVLLDCPSDRIGLFTIGDNDLTVIDDVEVRRLNLEIHDGKAEQNGVILGSVRSAVAIHGVSG